MRFRLVKPGVKARYGIVVVVCRITPPFSGVTLYLNHKNQVEGGTDSTIAPPPNPAIFCNERFMAGRHEERCCEKNVLTQFHVCKGLSNDDVGAARGTTVFQ